jgi:protein-disulfide isomerase
MMHMRKLSLFSAVLAGFILVLGMVSTIGSSARAAEQTLEEMLADRVLGDPEASVTIYEYSSLACPHCATFHSEVLPKVKEKYIDTGKAKLVFRDFPTGGDGGSRATIAAMLARCAPPEQYFGFLDVLFRTQANWFSAPDPIAALGQIGQLGGMGAEAFDACMNNETLFQGIRNAQVRYGKDLHVESTPTFIFNDDEERIVSNRGWEEFDAVMSELVE